MMRESPVTFLFLSILVNQNKANTSLRDAGGDFAVLAGMLAGINVFVSSDDPGWLTLNPTPFLLIPVLLAVRYGFWAGTIGGFFTACLIVLVRDAISSSNNIVHIALEYRYTLTSLPLSGALIGQLAESIKNRSTALMVENERLQSETNRLKTEREVLTLSKQDLQQRLGLFAADSASLDEDLQKLLQSEPESATQLFLSILRKLTVLHSAAIYQTDDESFSVASFKFVTAIGKKEHFPEALHPEDHQIILTALTEKSLMAQSSILEHPPTREAGYLLAVPMPCQNGSLLLVVQDLPFSAISTRTFTMIETLCHWFEIAVLKPGVSPAGHRVIDQEKFYEAVENAIATHSTHARPSTLVRIPVDVPFDNPALNHFLAELPYSCIITNTLVHGQRLILILFPAISNPQLATKLLTALGTFASQIDPVKTAKPSFLLTTPDTTSRVLLKELLGETQTTREHSL